MYMNKKLFCLAIAALALSSCKRHGDGDTRAMSPNSLPPASSDNGYSGRRGQMAALLEPMSEYENYRWEERVRRDGSRSLTPDRRYPGIFPQCSLYVRRSNTVLGAIEEGRKALVKVNGRIQILIAAPREEWSRRNADVGPFNSRQNFPIYRGQTYETVYRNRAMTLTLTQTYRNYLEEPLVACTQNDQVRLGTRAVLRVGQQFMAFDNLSTSCEAICSR